VEEAYRNTNSIMGGGGVSGNRIMWVGQSDLQIRTHIAGTASYVSPPELRTPRGVRHLIC
jgi:hypothetical protein